MNRTEATSPGGAIRVRNLGAGEGSRWDEFVRTHPRATFFHLAGWKQVIEQAFGHRTHYLLAEDDSRIRAVLPLGHVRSRLFGNALISVPFCVYGGTLAEDDVSRDVLTSEACGLAERLRVDYLELRNLERENPGWPSKDLYVTFRKEIEADPDQALKAIPRKQRAMVRKGINAGLDCREVPGIEEFFDVYSQSVRNLGTPVLPRKYFRILKEVFGDECEVLSVRQGDRVLSGVMSFYFRDEVLPYYGGGTAGSRAFAANDFMYWELMRRACEKGLRVFDYGRSKQDTGAFRFKKHWGFTPQPLHYEYHLVRAKTVPNVSPTNPRYQRFIDVWKRLPLGLTQIVGPMVAKYLA